MGLFIILHQIHLMQWACLSFYIKFTKKNILIVSDRWRELLYPFGRKEPNVRKSRDRKIEHFEFTPVDYTPVDHMLIYIYIYIVSKFIQNVI